LSSKVYKNYQVNVGIPFQIRNPLNIQQFQPAHIMGRKEQVEVELKEEINSEEIINNARQEAELIIREAQYEAMRLVETAERESNEIRASIEEEARQQGYKEGLEEVKRQYEDLMQEAEFIKEHARIEYKEVLEGIEAEALAMIMEIARNVIGTEISFNKEDILYLVKQAFEKCANKEKITLRVSADDYEYVEENKERLITMVEGLSEFEIKKDVSFKMGACIIDTPFGSIDAGIHTKLKKIEEAFMQAVGREC
jgi:flagellar assembly protein FliH